MPAVNRTSEFRDLLKEKQASVPEAKRRKLSHPAKRTPDEQRDAQEVLSKEYITEGYNIVRICCLPYSGLYRLKRQVAQPHQHPDPYAIFCEEAVSQPGCS